MDQQLETKDVFEDEYDSLPENIKEVLSSPEAMDALEGLGKKFNIHLDQLDDLFEEVGFILLGISRPVDFVDNLQKRLGLPREQINAIAREVNEKIFEPIRESLKEIHGPEDGQLSDVSGVLDEKVEPIIPAPAPIPTAPTVSVSDETLKQTQETLKELGIEHIVEGEPSEVIAEVPENLPTEPEPTAPQIQKPAPSDFIIKPTLASEKIAVAKEEMSAPPVATKVPQPIETPQVEPTHRAVNVVPDDIFASKLTGTISIPDQKIDMSKGAINKPSVPYKVDPYREPLT